MSNISERLASFVGRTVEVKELVDAVEVGAATATTLGIDGEQVHPVVGPDDIEAHTLFCARAAQADDRFDPSDGDGRVIDTICRRLDGIPRLLMSPDARRPCGKSARGR
jgi:predicted ATPase